MVWDIRHLMQTLSRICSAALQRRSPPRPAPQSAAAAVRAMYTTPKKNRKFAQVVSAGTASCRKRHNTVKKCDKDADEVVWCTVKT
jgi:hypothetical protein